ncbi:MAG: aKG-HExxH-type peptide beta-hydroxylase [Fluviicola sp.]
MTMLAESLRLFVLDPLTIWKNPNFEGLVQSVFPLGLSDQNLIQYSNFSYLLGNSKTAINSGLVLKLQCEKSILIEYPVPELKFFYSECGLDPIEKEELLKETAISKILNAFNALNKVPGYFESVIDFVRSITIVKSEGPDYDTSYSHPNLPLSIFFSLCADDEISNLRVAESILHEAMHLKLSLIEKSIQLVRNPEETYFSPWRDEQRPIGGVLHGIFVFSTILDFYRKLLVFETDHIVVEYLQFRCENIETEMKMVVDFPFISGLTAEGRTISKALLQYCMGEDIH